MRYSEIMESEETTLEQEVEFLHKEYHPEENDDFHAIADMVSSQSPFTIDELITAYYAKYGNPYQKKKVSKKK